MKDHTTREKADAFDGVVEAFRHLNKELKALGMKKPAETLSESKVKFINRILIDIQAFMNDEPEGRYLDLLDDEALPQYSDAILILSQYEGSLSGFRSRYHGYVAAAHEHTWRIR
jgi:hypothetical protein